jgi:uncharacterized protein YjbI with pentapeptide repeats
VITSADHLTFAVGSAGSFTVTTAPAASTIAESGALPSGVTFQDNGNGTATLAGTPAAGTGGSYPINITAGNGVPPNAVQSFTLTVTDVPSITSANQTTFNIGAAGTFTVTTHAGFPTATTLTETGALPSGVTFTDNGDGTATLAGTPAVGTSGSYPVSFTATNSAGHTAQSFTLSVQQGTTTTSVVSSLNASQQGQSVTFTATVSSSSSATPGGSVTFYDGSTALGSRTLAGGHATLSISTLTIGTHAIKVTYAGNSSFIGSNSSPLVQFVDTNISKYLSGGIYNLSGRDLKNSFLAGAKLDRGNLSHGNFSNSNISFASITFANLFDANFERADLHQSDLSHSNLGKANFKAANLNGALLVGADLTGTNFDSAMLQRANLNGAILKGTNFRGANLRGATLAGATLSQVKWDNTICPDGTNSNTNVGKTCVGHF